MTQEHTKMISLWKSMSVSVYMWRSLCILLSICIEIYICWTDCEISLVLHNVYVLWCCVDKLVNVSVYSLFWCMINLITWHMWICLALVNNSCICPASCIIKCTSQRCTRTHASLENISNCRSFLVCYWHLKAYHAIVHVFIVLNNFWTTKKWSNSSLV